MIIRERYMDNIRDFIDKPVIKVITGMRRSGKSALLELTRQELLGMGKDPDHIIYMNFESLRYDHLKEYKALYRNLIELEKKISGKFVYCHLPDTFCAVSPVGQAYNQRKFGGVFMRAIVVGKIEGQILLGVPVLFLVGTLVHFLYTFSGGAFVVKITGRDLELRAMTGMELLITGRISQIQLG